MLRPVKKLNGYVVHATDGDIGEVHDFYFDDSHWTIRYLVVDALGNFGERRQVLISPISFGECEWDSRRFEVVLTREKVLQSPNAEQDRPVSRQYEREYFKYYNWPAYWGYGGSWGPGELPALLMARAWQEPPDEPDGDPHLRSAREVRGYHIRGTDGEIGHVTDFLVDDKSWAIRYLLVDTSNWWFGKTVLLAPHWIESISWVNGSVCVALPRDSIKNGPTWDPAIAIDADYEEKVIAHYRKARNGSETEANAKTRSF